MRPAKKLFWVLSCPGPKVGKQAEMLDVDQQHWMLKDAVQWNERDVRDSLEHVSKT
jgi:hypothetical protein